MPGRRYIDPATLFNIKYKQLTAIPAKLDARYYFGNFYLAGEGGVVFLQNYTNSTNAVLSLGLGDKIKIGQRRLDISARQEVWFTPARNLNMAVVRVAYEIVWQGRAAIGQNAFGLAQTEVPEMATWPRNKLTLAVINR
jgi:hypothetical protein